MKNNMKKTEHATLEEILKECYTSGIKLVDVPGFSKPVRMKTIPFADLCEIRENTLTQEESSAFLVSKICIDINLDAARKLQENGAKFAMLLSKADSFCSFLTDDNIKN